MLEDPRTVEAVAAAKRVGAAQELYVARVLEALEAGVSVASLASALGVSRQAVNQMRRRHSKPVEPAVTDSELDKRIGVIERKWARMVEFYASQWGDTDSDRVAQAGLNRQSAARKARRRTKLSVKGSRLAFAETKLLSLIHEERDQVPVFARALEELAVLDELLQERERRNDARF